MINKEIQEIIDNDKYLKEVIDLNDYMARNPELSGQEYEASKRMVEILRSKGIEVEYPYQNIDTSFKATISGKCPEGPRICIMAEYDALPEVGHGCGHSASGSITILAGLIINDLREYFNGEVVILGTPDEEVLGGKIALAKLGEFDDYDYAIMMHMSNQNAANSKFLALDGLKVEFFGKSTHASASPWEGRNALNAIQLFFHSLDMMRQHVKPDVRIHGIIKEGGKAPNVVPDYTLAELYIRGNDAVYVHEISEWAKDCAKGASLCTKTGFKISALCDSLKDIAPNSFAENAIDEKFSLYNMKTVHDYGAMGSSDIGEVDYICPAFHPVIKVREDLTLHTKEFANEMLTENGHNAIKYGGRIIASFVMETLLNSELLENIKAEYRTYRKKQ